MKNNKICRNYRSRWTLQEMRYVETHYGTQPAKAIAAYLGRPVKSVSCMAGKLGVARPTAPWTEEEDTVLQTAYAQGVPRAQVMAILPGRAWPSIGWRAAKLGIYRPGRWQPEELRILREFYPCEGMAVARRLSGRTPEAVRLKACETGLQVDGFTPGRRWSEAEWDVLAAHPELSFVALAARLPGRTPKQVSAARGRLSRRRRRNKTEPSTGHDAAGTKRRR